MLKRLLLPLVAVIGSGCTTMELPRSSTAINSEQWQFTGKFVLRTPMEKKSAKIHWSQIDDQYHINFYTILGLSVMSITGDDHYVTLKSQGKQYTGKNAQQLIYQLTQWHLPVNQLQSWVTGQVHNATQVSYNQQGYFSHGVVSTLENRQWQLTLSDYKTVGKHIRPHRLLLQSGPSYFKLAITQWKTQ